MKGGFGGSKNVISIIEFIIPLHDLEQSTQELKHEQMVKLIFFPFQTPLVDVPSKMEVHILDSQPIPVMTRG
jgi:hypothetical protein